MGTVLRFPSSSRIEGRQLAEQCEAIAADARDREAIARAAHDHLRRLRYAAEAFEHEALALDLRQMLRLRD